MGKIITNKNVYGEKIHVKLVDSELMVHHEDCTEDYITLNELVVKYILNGDELVKIYNSAKELYAETLKPEIGELFKSK